MRDQVLGQAQRFGPAARRRPLVYRPRRAGRDQPHADRHCQKHGRSNANTPQPAAPGLRMKRVVEDRQPFMGGSPHRIHLLVHLIDVPSSRAVPATNQALHPLPAGEVARLQQGDGTTQPWLASSPSTRPHDYHGIVCQAVVRHPGYGGLPVSRSWIDGMSDGSRRIRSSLLQRLSVSAAIREACRRRAPSSSFRTLRALANRGCRIRRDR